MLLFTIFVLAKPLHEGKLLMIVDAVPFHDADQLITKLREIFPDDLIFVASGDPNGQ